MKIEDFEKIFEETNGDWKGDNAYQGLQLIAKYIDPMKDYIITCGGHDIMGSVDVGELIEAGITNEDVKKLALLNWSLEDDSLQCFV